ncbi:NAD-P-binding protein [Mycena amicta]|nr:NAD-P-binding protein [Mycena amicta]
MSLPAFGALSTAQDVASALSAQITGKNVLITGTSQGGIGFETALAIAKYANLVVITGHNTERLNLSYDAIKAELPSARVKALQLDLSSLASVRKAAQELIEDAEPFHVIIHNAAATIGEFKLTEDGFESQLATNHIGPFLLTKLLLPQLLASTSTTTGCVWTPRIVYVSSLAHSFARKEDLQFNTAMMRNPNAETYEAFDIYCQTKAAAILMAKEVTRRAAGTVHAFSLHPGGIFTNIMKKRESIASLQARDILTSDGQPSQTTFPNWKSVEQGAATTLAAAFEPRIEHESGGYLSDCVLANQDISQVCLDIDHAIGMALWDATEEVLDKKLSF